MCSTLKRYYASMFNTCFVQRFVYCRMLDCVFRVSMLMASWRHFDQQEVPWRSRPYILYTLHYRWLHARFITRRRGSALLCFSLMWTVGAISLGKGDTHAVPHGKIPEPIKAKFCPIDEVIKVTRLAKFHSLTWHARSRLHMRMVLELWCQFYL